LRAYFQRLTHDDDPDRRKIALVATAHHLARIMAAMLRTGETWRESSSSSSSFVNSSARAAISPPEDTEPITEAVSSVASE
jgi:hypothetical protein